MISTIFFDLYGTLASIETQEASPHTTQRWEEWVKNRYGPVSLLREQSRPLFSDFQRIIPPPGTHTEPDIAHSIADHLHFILQRSPSQAEISEAALEFRLASRRHLFLFPGTMQALTILKTKFSLGLVSNAQALFTYPELRELRLEDFFQPLIISSEIGLRKPSEAIFRLALERARVSATEALFVGNDPREDIAGAAQVGLRTAWVKDLDRQRELPIKPSITINSVSELPQQIGVHSL